MGKKRNHYPEGTFPHGTTTGYNNRKCRCRECTNAWTEYIRTRKGYYKKGERPKGALRNIAKLPNHFCVYKAYQDNLLLYIGSSSHLRSRLSQHKTDSIWWTAHNRIEIIEFDSEEEMLRSERSLIQYEAPIFNIIHNG